MADPDQIPPGQGEALKLIHDKVDAHVEDTIRPEFQALSTTLKQDTHEALKKAKVDQEREISLLRQENQTLRNSVDTIKANATQAHANMEAQLQEKLDIRLTEAISSLIPNTTNTSAAAQGSATDNALADVLQKLLQGQEAERLAREQSVKKMNEKFAAEMEEKHSDILKPEKFCESSATQSAQRHCEEYRQYIDSKPGDKEKNRLKSFSNYKGGKALVWYQAYITTHKGVNYDTLEAAFKEYFMLEDKLHAAQAMRVQGPKESIEDYAMALDITATAHNKTLERKTDALLLGLRADIRQVVIQEDVTEWKDILKVAKKYENLQKVSEDRMKETLQTAADANLEAKLESMQAQLKSMSQVNSLTAKTHKPQSNKNPPKKVKSSDPKPAQTEAHSSEDEEQDLNLMSHEHLKRQEQRALKDQGKPPYNQNRNSGYSRGGYQGKNFNPDHKRPYRGGYRGRGGNNSNSHSQNYTQSRNQDNRSRDNNRRQDDQRRDYSSSRRDYSSSRDNQHSYRSRDNSKSRDTHQGYKPNTQGYNPSQQQPQQPNQQQPQQEDILQKIKQLLGSSNSGN